MRDRAWWLLLVFFLAVGAAWVAASSTSFVRDSALADAMGISLTALLALGLTVYTIIDTRRARRSDRLRRLADFKNEVDERLYQAPQGWFAGSDNVVPVGYRVSGRTPRTVTEPLGSCFQGLPAGRHRLVILGEPGSGKTVAATQLMAYLMAGWQEGQPVPVRVSLSTWNTRRTLEEWLTDHLTASGLTPSRPDARELLDNRLVLPILDGLDEMDPPDVPARESRALEALRQLNEGYGGRTGRAPLVVVCRRKRYAELAAKERLRQATTVTLQPLDSEQQLEFLRQSGLEDDSGDWLPEWRGVAGALTWSGTPRGLAAVLRTPLLMSLLITAYTEKDEHHSPLRSPDDLLAMAPAEVHDHLLGLYTRVAAASFNRHQARAHRRRRDPERVERQLALLARRMRESSRPGNAPASGNGRDAEDEVVAETDLVLHRLWRLGRADPGVAEGLLQALVFLGSIMLARRLGLYLPQDLTSFAALAAVLWYVWLPQVTTARRRPVPRQLHWGRLPDWRFVVPVLFWTASLALYLWDGLRDQPALYGAILFGYFAPIPVWWASRPIGDHPQATLTGPRDPLRAELRYALAMAASASLAFGAIASDVMDSSVGFAYGITLTTLPALSHYAPGWLRYLGFKSETSRLLPPRLGAFLDWNCEAGILRVEGFAYQFRHRELQDWLARSGPAGPADREPEPAS
ncbi:NACHT domain-containing protein [Streptomyces sp. NPDC048172]|uniref:NACHT domain-containing protein n=1 Tax=Streptomyces sp. NPDC048172 TaxID=3365505 RepID=UPI0037195C22